MTLADYIKDRLSPKQRQTLEHAEQIIKQRKQRQRTTTKSKTPSSHPDEIMGPSKPQPPPKKTYTTGTALRIKTIQDTIKGITNTNKQIDPQATYRLDSGETITGKQLQYHIARQGISDLTKNIGKTKQGTYIQKNETYYHLSPEQQYLLETSKPETQKQIIQYLGSTPPKDFVGPIDNPFSRAYQKLSTKEKQEYGYKYTNWGNIPTEKIQYYPGGKQYLQENKKTLINRYLETHQPQSISLEKYASKGGIWSGKNPDDPSLLKEYAWEKISLNPQERKTKYWTSLPSGARYYSSLFHSTTGVITGTLSLPYTITKLSTGTGKGIDFTRYTTKYDMGHGIRGPGLIQTGIGEGIGAVTGESPKLWERMKQRPIESIFSTGGELLGSYLMGKGISKTVDYSMKGLRYGTQQIGKGIRYSYTKAEPFLPKTIQTGYTKLFSKTYPGKWVYDVGTGNIRRSGGIISRYMYDKQNQLTGGMTTSMIKTGKTTGGIKTLFGITRSQTRIGIKGITKATFENIYKKTPFRYNIKLTESIGTRIQKIPFLNKTFSSDIRKIISGSNRNIWTTQTGVIDDIGRYGIIKGTMSPTRNYQYRYAFLGETKNKISGFLRKRLHITHTMKSSGQSSFDDIIKIGPNSLDDISFTQSKSFDDLISSTTQKTGNSTSGGGLISQTMYHTPIDEIGYSRLSKLFPNQIMVRHSTPSLTMEGFITGSISSTGYGIDQYLRQNQMMNTKIGFQNRQDQYQYKDLFQQQKQDIGFKQIQNMGMTLDTSLLQDTSFMQEQKTKLQQTIRPMQQQHFKNTPIYEENYASSYPKIGFTPFFEEKKKKRKTPRYDYIDWDTGYRQRTWKVPTLKDLLGISF